MENPADVWDHPFQAQTDDYGKFLVLLVTLNRRPIAEQVLAESYDRLLTKIGAGGLKGRRDFISNIRILSGSLLSRRFVGTAGETTLDLFNPSIGDYVLRNYTADLPTLSKALTSLRTLNAAETLRDLRKSDWISNTAYVEILTAMLKEFVSEGMNNFQSEYVAFVGSKLVQQDDCAPALKLAANWLIRSELSDDLEDSASFVCWAFENEGVSGSDARHFATCALEQSLSSDELSQVAVLVRELVSVGEAGPHLEDKLEHATYKYFDDVELQEIDRDRVFEEVDFEDYSTAEDNVEALIDERLDGAHPYVRAGIRTGTCQLIRRSLGARAVSPTEDLQ